MKKGLLSVWKISPGDVVEEGGRGGGWRGPTKFYTGRLHPEFQPLTPLYHILTEELVPLLYTLNFIKVSLSHAFITGPCYF